MTELVWSSGTDAEGASQTLHERLYWQLEWTWYSAYSVSRACTRAFSRLRVLSSDGRCGDVSVAVAGGADSTSVSPIGVSKKLARALVDLQKARSVGAKWAIIKRLGLKDLLPVPPAVAEYSTGYPWDKPLNKWPRLMGFLVIGRTEPTFAHRSHQLAAEQWRSGVLAGEVMTAYSKSFKGRFFSR